RARRRQALVGHAGEILGQSRSRTLHRAFLSSEPAAPALGRLHLPTIPDSAPGARRQSRPYSSQRDSTFRSSSRLARLTGGNVISRPCLTARFVRNVASTTTLDPL